MPGADGTADSDAAQRCYAKWLRPSPICNGLKPTLRGWGAFLACIFHGLSLAASFFAEASKDRVLEIYRKYRLARW
ncbi:MAG: hypothetical protein ACI9UA_004369 [Pseudoalteromonas tetraodonis]|jgi:hypothetical protein